MNQQSKTITDSELMKTAELLAGFGSWQLDVVNNNVTWSDGAFRIYGYNPGEIEPSYNLFLTHVHPADVSHIKEKMQYAWDHLNAEKLQFRIIDTQDAVKYLRAELVIERNQMGVPLRVTGFKQDITEKILLEQTLAKEKLSRQKEITNAVIAAQERERLFLGEELHNNINPILATVRLFMDCAILDDQRSKALIEEAKEFISSAMLEIRNLSKWALPPSLRELGLLSSLNDLVENFELATGIKFEKQWKGIHENKLSEKLKLTVYRIVQEQLDNILKHAKATKVTIVLRQSGNNLKLVIKDDGAGFDPSQKITGVGIQNISSRADLFNGKVCINTHPGMGYELTADFTDTSI